MAGVSSTFPLKTTPFSTIPSKTSPLPFILTPFQSKLFGLRLSNSSFIKLSSASLSSSPKRSIAARYGGGGGNRSSGGSNNRRSRQQNELVEDQVIDDISSIQSATVRLIDEKQNMVGIVSVAAAKQMADDAELNLVIVSPDADPPVLRIIDYSKFRYEQQKRKKDQQKKSSASRMDMKELKMGYNIDQHDYSVRMRAAKKFLKDGDKVKVIVNLKGRENDFRNIAIELLRRFQNDVGELATEESKNFRDRNIFIMLVPNKAVLQKAQEPPKNREKSELNEVSAGT